MSLSPTQQQQLAADIAANANTIPAGQPWTGSFAGVAVSAVPHTADGAFAVAGWYNQTASPAFYGNYASVPVATIRNCINWAKLTPVDAPSSTNAAMFMACQGCQWNLELMGLIGTSGTIDCTKKNVVQGLNDALKAVPSGAGGAAQDAGWSGTTGVKQNICRAGTNAEKLFADASGGTGVDTSHAATFTFEGSISDADIRTIWSI